MAIEKQIETIDLSAASYASKTTVVGQENIPALGVREMQESVEYMPRNLLLPKLNEVVGAVNQCYTKAETDKAIGDKMTEIGAGDMVKAVYDPNGEGLNFTDLRTAMRQVAVLQTDVGNLKCVTVNLPASGWSGSAPYTQTVSVSGMTEDWVPGGALCKPVVNGDGSLNVAESMAVLEQMSYVKFLETGNGTVKAYCPYVKPTRNIQLRLPGTVEKG